jgi:hypothetical protein
MKHARRGLAALCLCGAALGLVALSGTLALGETGAHWNVNGKSIGTSLLPQVVVKEIEGLSGTKEKHIAFVTQVGISKVEILCEKMVLDNYLFHQNGSGLGTILVSECKTLLNGAVSSSCKPAEPITAVVKSLIVLHEPKAGEKVPVHKFEPAEAGAPFLILKFSEECALGEEVEVTGSFTLIDSNGKFQNEEVTHLVQEGPLGALQFGTHAAKLAGSVVLELTGEHKGMTWSGTPA